MLKPVSDSGSLACCCFKENNYPGLLWLFNKKIKADCDFTFYIVLWFSDKP